MTSVADNTSKSQTVEIVDKFTRKSLALFKTDIDRYGRDVAAMSDFFDRYVQQMSMYLMAQSTSEIVSELPVSNLGIIYDVIHQADIIMRGNITLIPDFDALPADIRSNLKKGIFKLGDSKQVDGNLRAVILDENDVRVKDITFKKVFNNPGNVETLRSIGNQLQMRQIYAKLADIQEFQTYQLEKDRDRDFIVPFLDARSLVLEAENKESEEERVLLINEAQGKIRTALNSVYTDIETTSKSFARLTNSPFINSRSLNRYMCYLTSDFQIATKYLGVRMQLLEYMGDAETAKLALQQYQHVMFDFLQKPMTKNGLSTASLMHDYFPYEKTNMNCWYKFSKEMLPALELGINNLRLGINVEYSPDVYIVSAEELRDEEK